MNHEEIAIGMGISRNTLEKHFGDELSHIALSKRIEVLSSMFNAAKKGNVSAQRAYMALQPKPAAPPIPKDPRPPVLGKKDQANVDAVSAEKGTSWDTLLPRSNSVQ